MALIFLLFISDTKAKEDMKSALEVLESHLQNVNSKDGVRTYLINSQHITLADIFLVSILIYPFTLVFDDVYLKHYKNTVRWFMNCVEQPEFIAVLGKIRLCKK
ncbi:MAG: glutathione S-transferase [Bacillariaceae sp.]|jgi:glutathione S-transferase